MNSANSSNPYKIIGQSIAGWCQPFLRSQLYKVTRYTVAAHGTDFTKMEAYMYIFAYICIYMHIFCPKKDIIIQSNYQNAKFLLLLNALRARHKKSGSLLLFCRSILKIGFFDVRDKCVVCTPCSWNKNFQYESQISKLFRFVDFLPKIWHIQDPNAVVTAFI